MEVSPKEVAFKCIQRPRPILVNLTCCCVRDLRSCGTRCGQHNCSFSMEGEQEIQSLYLEVQFEK